MSKKVLIVGGVAGGASAAARLRRLDETAHIVMFERDPYISFANCGLPYYIGGSIQDRSKLIVQTPEGMRQRFNLDIRTESEVISINPSAKTVQVRSREHGLYEESYDSLILSPGAKPVRPPLPGINNERILTLRNIPDTDKVKTKVKEEGTRSAIVIGGGFIGVEMAENLKEAGLDVTLIEAGSQLLAPFDPEMASVLAKELEDRGIRLLFSGRVQSFQDDGTSVYVHMDHGNVLQADMVLLAIGVTPDTDFLKGSGLELGSRGHILVNDRLQTNIPDIYAVGDAIEVTDYISGSKTAIPLAGPANKQGRIAADNVAGLNTIYKGTQGTSIIKVFGLTGATTGHNEKTLQRMGIPHHVIFVHPQSHASYYPGATPISLKLLFGEAGRVLGAQAVGYGGVDKRIDDIAAVIRFKGTIQDLAELELAYAPPYSSAKDPVNMAGYAAENILAGRTEVFLPRDLKARDPDSTILVDVRTEIEHLNGHIDGSVHLPVDNLRDRLHELDPAKEIWVYCQVGLRGYTASRILQQHGFRVKNLTGGYKTYLMSGYQPKAWKDIDSGLAPSDEDSRPEIAAAATVEPRAAADDQAGSISEAVLDVCGLSCPGPLIQVKQHMDQLPDGQSLRVTASDPGFYEDIQAWAGMTGNRIKHISKRTDGLIEALIKKIGPEQAATPEDRNHNLEGSTMIVFSGDLDRAIASFIIANGAASSGKKVTMFFTFWGLNVIRKPEKILAKKSFMGRMFSWMMPRGSLRLPLSKMNMMGMGPKMIRGVMNSHNISSLEELMETAIAQGVEVVACQMSMELMGITKEELLDGIKIGGVGYYLGKADHSGINLFV